MLPKAETKKSGDLYNIYEREHCIHDTFTHRTIEHMDIEKSKRILLVDGDNAIRKILLLLLSGLKFKVKSVDNAYDALSLFINEGSELVLTDIQIPGMDGWELAFNIKKISPKTPVILMAGMEKHEIEDRIKNAYADFILFKPINVKYLKKIVYGFLANQG